MKHIFKKLHHHPNRPNETPQQSPPPPSSSYCSDAARPASSSSSSSATDGGNTNTNTNTNANTHTNSNTPQQLHPPPPQQDFYASVEEFEVQLAMALSVSSSGQDSALIDSQKTPIRSTDYPNAAADVLSHRYWDFGVLDFEERVVDGFYDVYNVSSDATIRGDMPSLSDLESDNGGSNYEVVIVNRKLDPALEELMQIAHCIVLDRPTTEITLLIQRLAELVTEHLGGPVRDANIILAKWMERSMELRTSLHTIVLPLGSLRIGLSRHRALLFKALADSVGIPCRLVKGSHYTGVDDDAVNIIKLQDDSEYLVDLMGAPGTLIPADVLSGKDAPSKPYSPEFGKFARPQATTDAEVSTTHGQNFVAHNFSQGATSSKPESMQSSFNMTDDGVGTSGHNDKVPAANLLDHNLRQAIVSSLYEGGHGSNLAGDDIRINPKMTPYNSEDPKNLFMELNPFQIKGSGKGVVKNDQVGKLQFSRNNAVSNQPPVPLGPKNHHAHNDIPKESQFDYGKGSLLNNNLGASNQSPAIARTSKVPPKASRLPGKVPNLPGANGYISSSNDFKPASGESGPGLLSSNVKETSQREDRDSMKIGETNLDGHKNDVTRFYKEKQNMQDRFIGTNGELMKTERVRRPYDLRRSYADSEIDDVGDCEIAWEDLDLGERIGLGSYGEVYLADLNGTEVAVKKFLDQDFSGAALDEFKREVRIMRRLRHPNVVLFMGAVTRPPNLSIITEYLPRGSLYRIIHRPHCQIDEKRRIKMALDVANGMNCLHTSIPTIVHRDLKSPNLLVDNNWNVKVGDFGLSRLKHNTFLSSKSTAGTPEWMAPEVLRNEPSNEKCDVYSFGVILWELATLKLPWSGMNPMQVVGAVGFQNRRLDIPKEVDPLVARIIWECWQMDPNLRPSFAQLSVALQPLQRLVVPSHVEQPQAPSLAPEISVSSTP
ncbi:serine/threonine-protein kinase EDR1 isoform X2 [Andrographis paniculata]|uniref:serine/threonine-protein kinase EDR1 isoform X2 n=1 Tax=Andrographis paniculata TaxID=175694 RepID=UPI0021E8D1D8|nr:serine/threonine-protein kinase EDR1 isoform X2 [Andrographis paniculata]